MILPDVNVLIYAFNTASPRHEEYRQWLVTACAGPAPFGVSDLVLSAVVRILTNPRATPDPLPLDEALIFVDQLRQQPLAVRLEPGPRHWSIFADLCRRAQARGNLITDAYFAALAIEHGCEFITTDRDYARFPGLRWRHPLDPP